MTFNFSNQIITCGPFVGSFLEEIATFRPFVNWVQTNLIHEDLFVLTHNNRKFLYDCKVLPIFEQFSIDDSKFMDHRNKDIDSRLYKLIHQSLSKDIARTTGYTQKEIISLMNKYPKNKIQISYYNKTFKPIVHPAIDTDLQDYVVFIPCKTEKRKVLQDVLFYLQAHYNVVVLGDNATHFQDINYFDTYAKILDRYRHMVSVINNAKMVVCPVGGWTFLCNLQQIPVVSWGNTINSYKNNGILNFNNKNAIFSTSNHNAIITMIKKFSERIF